MKIEFVKEEKLNGDITYYTTIDGGYVSNSLSLKEKDAKKLFEMIVKDHEVVKPKKTVLKTVELNEEK